MDVTDEVSLTMSLIKCPECKKEVSDTASSCPSCGRRLKRTRNLLKVIGSLVFVALALVFVAAISHETYVPIASEFVWSMGFFPSPYQTYLRIEHAFELRKEYVSVIIPNEIQTIFGLINLGWGDLTEWRGTHGSQYQGRGRKKAFIILARIIRGHAQDTIEGDYLLFDCNADKDPSDDYVAIAGWHEAVTLYFNSGQLIGVSSEQIIAGREYQTGNNHVFSGRDHEKVKELRRRASTVISIVAPEKFEVWPLFQFLVPSRSRF